MSGLCGKELMNLRQNTFENIVGKGEMPVTSILSVFHNVFHLLLSFPNQISLFFFLFILLSPNLFNFKDSEEAFRKHYVHLERVLQAEWVRIPLQVIRKLICSVRRQIFMPDPLVHFTYAAD